MTIISVKILTLFYFAEVSQLVDEQGKVRVFLVLLKGDISTLNILSVFYDYSLTFNRKYVIIINITKDPFVKDNLNG